jgi:hypothetical protein
MQVIVSGIFATPVTQLTAKRVPSPAEAYLGIFIKRMLNGHCSCSALNNPESVLYVFRINSVIADHLTVLFREKNSMSAMKL